MLTLLFIWIGIPATFGILALLSIEHFYLRKYLPGGYQHFEKLRKNWEIAKKIREDWRDNHPFMDQFTADRYEDLWLIELGAEELLNIMCPWTGSTSWSEYKIEHRNHGDG